MVERTKALTPSTEESVQNLMPWKREYEIKTSGGTAKWIFAHSIPEKNKDGSVV